jgi:hypothetical protein
MMTLNFFEPWDEIEEGKIDQLKVLMDALLKALKSAQPKRWQGHASATRNFGWRAAQWTRDKER